MLVSAMKTGCPATGNRQVTAALTELLPGSAYNFTDDMTVRS
jgi:hypothetical protein